MSPEIPGRRMPERRSTKIVVESCDSLHDCRRDLARLKLHSPQNGSRQQSFLSSASDLNDCGRQDSQLGSPVAAQPLAPSDGFLACRAPSLLATLRRQGWPLLLPAALLLAAVIVSAVVVTPSPTVVYYLIAYALSFAASSLWLAICYAVQTKRFLATLVDCIPRVFTNPNEELSSDPAIRYVQACVYHRSVDAVRGIEIRERNDDPLAFMRDVLAFKALDLKDGHCVVDPTGTVLWCNDALATYFGWQDGGLVGENVRVLMPAPYCAQHDALIRNYNRDSASNIVGCKRRVPVIDRSGTTSTALLGVEEYVDPMDPGNYLFLGSMTFAESEELDPAMVIQDRLNEGVMDIVQCCAALATHHENLVVINAQGTIEWVSDSATWLLQYGFGELVGANVKCLMAEEHAKQHDGFLARYQERHSGQCLGAGAADSRVVGRSRDLYARTKSGELVRIYLTVRRLDRPSRQARDCLFLGSLLLVQKPKEDTGGRARGPAPSQRSSNASANVTRVGLLSPLTARKCSLVVLEIAHLDPADVEALHRDLSAFFNIAGSLSAKYKAVLHHPVGDRLYISLNNTLLNNAHRSNAGTILHSACQQWKFNHQQSRAKLYAAGVSGTCTVGQFMTSGVMVSSLVDLSAVLLRTAVELDHAHPIIDAALHEDLQFAFDCRPINLLTVFDELGKPHAQHIYELQSLKAVEDDEWLYQLGQTEKRDELARWRQCWEALGPGAGWPDYAGALAHLTHHLHDAPRDTLGTWLLDALRARQAGRTAPAREVMGKLQYCLQFRSEDLPVSKAVVPFSYQPRP